MLCSEIQFVKGERDFEDIKPLPCNRWSCEHCSAIRRKALMALAAAGEPNKILTLTVNPGVGRDPNHRRLLLHDAWKRLVKRILRRHGWKVLPYMAFLERTKAGEPHLHILLRCGFVAQKWIAAQMKEMIGAPIVWIEQIKGTSHAVRYVTKYVAKEPAQFGNGKRYWVSRTWEVNKGDKPQREPFDRSAVAIVRGPWSETLQRKIMGHWTWYEMGDGWLRFERPGTHGSQYGLIKGPDG